MFLLIPTVKAVVAGIYSIITSFVPNETCNDTSLVLSTILSLKIGPFFKVELRNTSLSSSFSLQGYLWLYYGFL